MTKNSANINQEILKMNKELKAEIERHGETTRQLLEKQQFLTNIMVNAPIVIWSIDLNGIFTYSQYSGGNALPDSERIGKSALEIYKGTEVETFLRKVLKEEISNDILTVNGVIYDTRVSPLFDHNGKKTGYMGVSMDITERIKTEKELEKFRLVLDQAPGAVYIMDKNWNFEYINPWFTRISGYKAEELLHKNISETLYKNYDKIPASRSEISQSLFEGKPWQGELHTINKDGSRYWANTIAAPFRDKNGKIDGYIIIQQDITEKKKIETELAEKENLYRTLIEKSLDGVSISQDGKIIMVNQAFCEMFGYTIDEILAKEPSELIAPHDRERVLDLHYKRMSGEIKTNSYLASMLHKNGSEIIVDINAATVQMNGQNASFVTMRDVTEKNRIQKALQESEIKYKTLVDNSQDGILIIRYNQILFANNTICRMLKTTPGQLTATPATDIVHPDDRKKAQAMSALRQKGETGTMIDNYRLMVFTGGYIETESFSTVIDYEGLPASFITIHNITEKNRMQEELVKSEQKYRTLIDKATDGIIITQQGLLKFVNKAFCTLTQYNENELIDKPYVDFVSSDDHDKMNSYHSRRMAGEDFQVMYRSKIFKKDGTLIEVELNARTSEYNGQPAAFIIMRDITNRVMMENALRDSEKRYRELAEMLPQTVYEHDLDGKLTYLNQAGKKTFGIDNLETGVFARDLVVAGDIERMLGNMQKSSFGNSTSRGNSYTAMRLNGEKFPVMIFATPMISEDKITGIRGIVIDMTEYVSMEKALRESELKYRTLIDKATDGILITQSGLFKFVNPAFCEMMQYTEKELINKPFIEVVDKAHHAEMLENHKRRMTGESFPAIYRAKLYRKDGSSIMVELNSRTTDFEGNPASFVITRDITDRLQTEEELRKAKKELEHLNQNLEIRVKESTLKLTEANTQLIRLQKENLQSQFEVLRQQVNPHFLFNSLNVLTSLIKLEPDLAEQFTEHLSKVYRYVLENKDNDLVNLHTELDFLDAYVFLLHIRFMDKIVIKVDIADDKKELLILPLALQLLIENAIKHNSMSKKNPLKIEITIDNENVLNVVNNLQERESHMVSTGVGLKNIEHRYHLLEMPAPQFIKTETKFIARIPLKY